MTSTVTELSDSSARQQALDTDASFIVSAPAGSGKTGLITQRVLALLATVDNPEEILCITFTRKAASEMKGRIHQALLYAHENPRPNQDFEGQTWDLATAALANNNQMGWNLLTMPNRLRIKTIDSFCHYVNKQFALESGLGELPQQSEFPSIYYHLAAREFIDHLEQDTDTAKLLAVIISHTGNDLSRCEKLFADMLAKREQWLPHIYKAADNQDYFKMVLQSLVETCLHKLHRQLASIAGELVQLADFAAAHAPEDNPQLRDLKGIAQLPTANASALAEWKALLGLLVTKNLQPRKRITAKEGFPAPDKAHKQRMQELLTLYGQDADLQRLVRDTMHLPETHDEYSQQPVLDALGRLLPQLVAMLKIIFQQHNVCDYPEITLGALAALDSNADDGVSDITLRLDYQLRHILIDEFQDTSGSQIKLLELLVKEWQETDGRTLFLVGDAMQSLYSFRDARVGLFINAQYHPIANINCKPLNLNSNFRSQKGIVDWVNKTFTSVFPSTAEINRGAVPYSHAVAVKETEDNTALSFYGISAEQTQTYERYEAEQIAQLCQTLQQKHPHQSTAILVRNRGHLRHIVPALKNAQLQWDAIDIDPLAERMPVVDIISLTRAMLSPADRIAWLAILRAPFCALSAADLLALCNGRGDKRPETISILHRLRQWQADRSAFPRLTDQGHKTLERVTAHIVKAWDNRGRENLRTVIERLWVNLGAPATLTDKKDIADIRTYLDLLERWQVAGTIEDWSQFQKAIEKLFTSPNQYNDNSKPPVSSTPIQIMTIHKAKGLEFDHVIVPGLSKQPRADENPLLRWQETVDTDNQRSLLMAVLGPHNEDNDPVYRYLRYEQGLRTELENARVLYVAATRAIRQLHLFARVTTAKQGWQKPSKTTLLAPLWPSIEKDLDQPIENGSYQIIELTDEEETAQPQDQAPPQFNYIRQLTPNAKLQSMPENMMKLGVENHFSEHPAADNMDTRARHQGTALHRTLKQIATEGIQNWPLERRRQLSAAWHTQLKQRGILATATELERLNQSLETMLDDAKGQWILQPHTDHQSEYALSYWDQKNGALSTSVIDRTFIAEDYRWIIDYKFSYPDDMESLEHFKQRQTQLYQAKLQHYASLFKQRDNKGVRCALYFPYIALFHEVNSN